MARFDPLTGEIAALERWALTGDRAAATAPAREAQWQGYLRKVDPDNKLDPRERHRRALALQRAHMLRMVAARRARTG